MVEMTEIERLRAAGLKDVVTAGEVLEGGEGHKPPALSFSPACLEGTPDFPEPGIYFGMPEEEYHAIPALSSSGTKLLAASPMLFWSKCAWLSPKRQREQAEAAAEKQHHTMGKAYHCRIMEGAEAFAQRFVVELDPAEHGDALVSTAQIKAAIGKHMTADTRKSASPGDMVPVKPVSKVPDEMPDGSSYDRPAVKADWIAQLLELEPDAKVFARIQAEFLAANPGKAVITAEQAEELEIAARMIERDPEVRHAFVGGHPEVSLFWYCPTTGVPMKARVDYLKIKAMVDLKTVTNQRERSIENAIRWEIASYKYNIQPAVYEEGVNAVREIVREHPTAIHIAEDYPYSHGDTFAWARKWASHRGGDEWLWVFQSKGDAPITRGVFYPLAGTTHMITKDIVRAAKRKFRLFSETFATSPWLDVAPLYTIADEDLPQSTCEI